MGQVRRVWFVDDSKKTPRFIVCGTTVVANMQYLNDRLKREKLHVLGGAVCWLGVCEYVLHLSVNLEYRGMNMSLI